MMAIRRILVVFFSRTGNTTEVAGMIQRAIALRGVSCDIERLRDDVDRRGLLGYLRTVFESLFDRVPELNPLEHDPSSYDLVIVGTPVWNASLATPVRAFLRQHGSRLAGVAFFLTHGSSGRAHTFLQMRRLAGKPAIAELAIREKEIDAGDHAARVQTFVADLIGEPVRSAAFVARAENQHG